MKGYEDWGEQAFIDKLHEAIRSLIEANELEQLERFTQLFYQRFRFDEFGERQFDDITGVTLSLWRFIHSRSKSTRHKIAVFNPNYEQLGWQSIHTVLFIVHDNMPFLLDSILMELNKRKIGIHLIQNRVLTILRDDDGKLIRIEPPAAKAADSVVDAKAEACLYIELDRHADEAALKALEANLEWVLQEVATIVDDFQEMKSEALAVVNQLSRAQCESTGEESAFLSWLFNEHFTFLGFQYWRFDMNQDAKIIEADSLGIFRFESMWSQSESINEYDSLQIEKPIVSFTKSQKSSKVHRPVYPDYIVIKDIDENGICIGEKRFLGLYTSKVANTSVMNIPLLRCKFNAVIKEANFDLKDHDGKELVQILEGFPKDEFLQMETSELYAMCTDIISVLKRRQIKLFIRADFYKRFYSCLIFLPKEIYNTELSRKLQSYLSEKLDAEGIEVSNYFSEQGIVRLHIILMVKALIDRQVDVKRLQHGIVALAGTWTDGFQHALIENYGEAQGNELFMQYANAYSTAYREDFSPRSAVIDIKYMETLQTTNDLSMSFYNSVEKNEEHKRFKLFNIGILLPLSDILPILENLGVRVIGERPYRVRLGEKIIWIHDFHLEFIEGKIESMADSDRFREAFRNIWMKKAECDTYNKLVLSCKIPWREVNMLRAYARYIKQIRQGFSQYFLSETLLKHRNITEKIIEAFNIRFNPALTLNDSERAAEEAGVISKVLEYLENVNDLNEDIVLRRYIELIIATVRTNFYQQDEHGQFHDYVSFKFASQMIPDIPLPKPMFEIFVYSPHFEGVHLRGGKVSRGGVRWSGRLEDYRTEILGLVKAQQVKNASIVPVGAKGGFVTKTQMDQLGQENPLETGIRAYQQFVSALLELTDNIVDGEIHPPKDVVRNDETDTYLLVAADKGTAKFSDIANEIAMRKDFWLGDGFASGGTNGFDHKKMGITAKGAWQSVLRHFREFGIDVNRQTITVLGIGDMAGDVFGNGMLLSTKIALVAAFNHQHIFIDPNPDVEQSYAERQRLFNLERSSWDDYDRNILSAGGNIFSRDAKWIALSPEIRRRFKINMQQIRPNQLIIALLKAKVDLLWNGGIGTYVKSKEETHQDVGDKTNDPVRVDADDLGAKVVGEGGNLGLTQLGRVQYCLAGGAAYTDFIDNSAGVSCSDKEVNLKILLNELVRRGELSAKQRNDILFSVIDEIEALVLENSYAQARCIALEAGAKHADMDEYRRLISYLESKGKLDRVLEYLPEEDKLIERHGQNKKLTRPELSVLMSYVKLDLKETFVEIEPDQTFFLDELCRAFPASITTRFRGEISEHSLRHEILATALANNIVNYMGLSFFYQMQESTGATTMEVVYAFLISREVFELEHRFASVARLDFQLPSEEQDLILLQLVKLVKRACRWFLRNRRGALDFGTTIQQFHRGIETVLEKVRLMLEAAQEQDQGSTAPGWRALVEGGVDQNLAVMVAGSSYLHGALDIVDAAIKTEATVDIMADIFFALNEQLELHWLIQQINRIACATHWQVRALETFKDDIEWQQGAISLCILQKVETAQGMDVAQSIDQWMMEQAEMITRWQAMLSEIRASEQVDIALLSVACRELLDLAQNSVHKST